MSKQRTSEQDRGLLIADVSPDATSGRGVSAEPPHALPCHRNLNLAGTGTESRLPRRHPGRQDRYSPQLRSRGRRPPRCRGAGRSAAREGGGATVLPALAGASHSLFRSTVKEPVSTGLATVAEIMGHCRRDESRNHRGGRNHSSSETAATSRSTNGITDQTRGMLSVNSTLRAKSQPSSDVAADESNASRSRRKTVTAP